MVLENIIPIILKIQFSKLNKIEKNLVSSKRNIKKVLKNYKIENAGLDGIKFDNLMTAFKENLDKYKDGRFYNHFSNKKYNFINEERIILGYSTKDFSDKYL